jgi:hypothetical protein
MEYSCVVEGDQQDAKPFDSDEAARMLGLSPTQKKFADGLLKGMNRTAAAQAAGYSGSGSSLRSAASVAAKSEKVVAYLAWAKNGGAGVPEAPCSSDELKKILSRHARSADSSKAIRAAEVLHRLHLAEREAERDKLAMDPAATLARIADLSNAMCEVIARAMAEDHGIPWEKVEVKRRRRRTSRPSPPQPPGPDTDHGAEVE